MAEYDDALAEPDDALAEPDSGVAGEAVGPMELELTLTLD